MKKNTHGGPRKKSGRKTLDPLEKRVMLSIYPKLKDIEKVGGAEKAKEIALNSIESS